MDGTADTATTDELVLAIPADPELIGVARLFAAAACRHAGTDEDRIDDVKVAVSEAVTNAVQAHLAADVADAVSIRIRIATDGLTVSVVDLGRGVAPEAAPADPAITPPAGLYEGSLGLSLIRSLFPDVVFGLDGELGTVVSFRVVRAETT